MATPKMNDLLPTGIRIEVYGSTTLANGDQVSGKVTYNCDGETWQTLTKLAGSSAWIRTQDIIRPMTTEDAEIHCNATIQHSAAGHKPVTREDRVKVFMAVGMTREQAEFAASNPDVFDTLSDELTTK